MNVNVQLEDVTIRILEDVSIPVAAQVVANICNIQVGQVVVLGRAVDAGGEDFPCDATTEDAPTITVTQND